MNSRSDEVMQCIRGAVNAAVRSLAHHGKCTVTGMPTRRNSGPIFTTCWKTGPQSEDYVARGLTSVAPFKGVYQA